MFERFTLEEIAVPEGVMRVRHGGKGPPLLLIHGCPQTSMMWGPIADDLAEHFHVVAPDLRGYGGGPMPETTPDHEPYSKRAMNRDQIALMRHFGHERFMVAGHDRGGRCAYRMAMDNPDIVTKLALLDIIPTAEVYRSTDFTLASAYWHWFFLPRAAPGPEQMMAATPDITFLGKLAAAMPAESVAEYQHFYHRPQNIHGMCEDYRAGIGIDRLQDEEDIAAGRKIQSPTLVLWVEQGLVGRRDPMAVWRRWCVEVEGQGIDCGHFLPEEKPAETLAALKAFFLR